MTTVDDKGSAHEENFDNLPIIPSKDIKDSEEYADPDELYACRVEKWFNSEVSVRLQEDKLQNCRHASTPTPSASAPVRLTKKVVPVERWKCLNVHLDLDCTSANASMVGCGSA